MSADVYCQNQNTRFGSHINILQQNGKKWKQASCQRDRERRCVCNFALPENGVGIRCKTATLGKGCHENLHIKVVCLRIYLNCEKGIKERAREKDTLRLQVVEKQLGDAQGHLRNDYISSTFSTI